MRRISGRKNRGPSSGDYLRRRTKSSDCRLPKTGRKRTRPVPFISWIARMSSSLSGTESPRRAGEEPGPRWPRPITAGFPSPGFTRAIARPARPSRPRCRPGRARSPTRTCRPLGRSPWCMGTFPAASGLASQPPRGSVGAAYSVLTPLDESDERTLVQELAEQLEARVDPRIPHDRTATGSAGRYLVNHCDVLIVLTQSGDPHGDLAPGVSRARARKRPILLRPTELDMVYSRTIDPS